MSRAPMIANLYMGKARISGVISLVRSILYQTTGHDMTVFIAVCARWREVNCFKSQCVSGPVALGETRGVMVDGKSP